MRKKGFALLSVCLIASAAGLLHTKSPLKSRVARPVNSHTAPTARIIESYGKLPLSFELNQGQTDPEVKFISRGSGYNLFLISNEAVLRLQSSKSSASVPLAPGAAETAALHRSFEQLTEARQSAPQQTTSEDAVLRMKLIGANPSPRVTGLDELPGKSNYFIGSDPTKWRTNVPTYAKVKYEDVYPGIDLVYYGNQGQMEYDFVVAPGADPHRIRFVFPSRDSHGAAPLRMDEEGNLLLENYGGDLRLRKPVVYQDHQGASREVSARYVLGPGNELAFQLGEYDRTKPVVIDPTLVYSTYLGGGDHGVSGFGLDVGTGIAADSQGNAYVTGYTLSTNFPTTSGAFQSSHSAPASTGADEDVFVAKLNASGDSLIYSTYIGGGLQDEGLAIAIDPSGNAYVTGSTTSSDFPAASAIQSGYRGGTCNGIPCRDVFVAKLNATGDALVYSTYLGGSGDDIGNAIALDHLGAAFVAGQSTSSDFPTTPGAFQTKPKGNNAFIAKIDSSGSALAYSTYIGGTGRDVATGIAIDSNGSAYIAGSTSSVDFPVTPGSLRTTYGGQGDAFISKFNPTGSALVYSTYLGGSGNDAASGIALDSAGNAFVAGNTMSGDFPGTPGAFQSFPTVPGLAPFVSKVNASGSALIYSTSLTGAQFSAIAVDSAGNAYLTGLTGSTLALVNPLQPAINSQVFKFGAAANAFVSEFNPSGSGLLFSTYFGGLGSDMATAIALDASGTVYITGATESANFPITPGAFQPTIHSTGGRNGDAFVAKIITTTNPVPKISSLSPMRVLTGSDSFTLTVNGSNFASNAVVRWGGLDRPTNFLSLSQLTASIPSTDLVIAGSINITVFNPAPGGGVSNVLTFLVGDNPVPQLTSLRPASAPAGSPGVLLTIEGSGFVQGAKVQWNGSDRPTTFTSPTQLFAAISASDLAVAGSTQVTVFNPAPGGGTSNALTFSIGSIPIINFGGIVPAASFGHVPLAVGSIASLFGSVFTSSLSVASVLPLPTTLTGVSVQVNGLAAPLFAVSPGQINFQIPWELQGQSQASVTVNVNGATSAPATINLAPFSPGIFTINQQGTGQGAILAGGTAILTAPVGTTSTSRPARRQEFVTIFCTGLGAVTNQPASGAAVPPIPQALTTTMPTVTVGAIPAFVSFSGLAPEFVGLYQVNIQVPPDAPLGDAVPVVINIGGVPSNTVTMAVQDIPSGR